MHLQLLQRRITRKSSNKLKSEVGFLLMNLCCPFQVGEWSRVKCACLKLLLRKFLVFSGIKKLFYPVLAYSIYLCVGPWLAGYLIDDRIGVVFAWGTFFQDGIFLKGTTTYLYCGIHIILFNGPLICILAHTADVR